MRTYVKIEGENVESIVQKLAKLAIDVPEVCVWDINIIDAGWVPYLTDYSAESMIQMGDYFEIGMDTVEKHCDRIISKSGGDLGDASIYFEWFTKPSNEQLQILKDRIDNILKDFGNKYIVTNKE